MIIPVALAAMLDRCAPNVGPITMGAVVQYESKWKPFAIGDNTTHQSYFPTSQASAVALASALIGRGDDIDMGLAQVNSGNLQGYGLSVAQVFDPCTNLYTGSRILVDDYRRAVVAYGPGQLALWHALQAYNTGRLNGRPSYASGVFQTAFSGVSVSTVLPPVSLPAASQTVTARTSIAVHASTSVLVWHPASHLRPLPLSGVNVFENPGAPTAPLRVQVTTQTSKQRGHVKP